MTVAFPCGPSALSVIKPQAWVESSHSLPARREPLSSRSASSALLHSAFWSSSGAEQFCFRAEHVNRFGILGFLPPCNFTGGNFEDISNIQAFGSSKEIIIIDCYNNRVDSANRGERADCLHGEEIGRSGGELGVGGGGLGGVGKGSIVTRSLSHPTTTQILPHSERYSQTDVDNDGCQAKRPAKGNNVEYAWVYEDKGGQADSASETQN